MKASCVLFDSSCAFCCQCVKWLGQQDQTLKMWCLPRGSRQALDAFGAAVNFGQGAAADLVVIDSDGGVYRGSDAFIMCLWAVDRYSDRAARFASPALKPYARSMFNLVSSKRHVFSSPLSGANDADVVARLTAVEQPAVCDDGVRLAQSGDHPAPAMRFSLWLVAARPSHTFLKSAWCQLEVFQRLASRFRSLRAHRMHRYRVGR